MQEIIGAISNSPLPVVGLVEPRTAQATSAGAFILLATDVAGMLPDTRVGAAHPVGAGEPIEGRCRGESDEQPRVAREIARGAARVGHSRGVAEGIVRESIQLHGNGSKTEATRRVHRRRQRRFLYESSTAFTSIFCRSESDPRDHARRHGRRSADVGGEPSSRRARRSDVIASILVSIGVPIGDRLRVVGSWYRIGRHRGGYVIAARSARDVRAPAQAHGCALAPRRHRGDRARGVHAGSRCRRRGRRGDDGRRRDRPGRRGSIFRRAAEGRSAFAFTLAHPARDRVRERCPHGDENTSITAAIGHGSADGNARRREGDLHRGRSGVFRLGVRRRRPLASRRGRDRSTEGDPVEVVAVLGSARRGYA